MIRIINEEDSINKEEEKVYAAYYKLEDELSKSNVIKTLKLDDFVDDFAYKFLEDGNEIEDYRDDLYYLERYIINEIKDKFEDSVLLAYEDLKNAEGEFEATEDFIEIFANLIYGYPMSYDVETWLKDADAEFRAAKEAQRDLEWYYDYGRHF